MIERASEFGASAAVPLTPGDAADLSAGDMLRRAREAHGLHVEAVAAALKVPPQKLYALEADAIEALPDPVFARALAASVCRALRIDPAPVLAKLPGGQRDGLAQADRSMSGNIRGHAMRHPARGGQRLPRPLLVVAGLLLAGAALLFWLPQSIFDRFGEAVSSWTSRSGPGAASPAANDAAPAIAIAPGTVVEPVLPTALPLTQAPIATAPSPPVVAPAETSATPAASSDLLVLSPRGDSWITVTEAGGKTLLRRTVKAGETVSLSGAVPLSVVVGRAAGVDVRVRGKALDLAPLIKSGGVARFEVK